MAATYSELVERGCLCGTDRIAECPLHKGPGDLRGLAAYFKAGQPLGFPLSANCMTPLDRQERLRGLTHVRGHGWPQHYRACRVAFGMPRGKALRATWAAYWINWKGSR
jgi:hypothetical protein